MQSELFEELCASLGEETPLPELPSAGFAEGLAAARAAFLAASAAAKAAPAEAAAAPVPAAAAPAAAAAVPAGAAAAAAAEGGEYSPNYVAP